MNKFIERLYYITSDRAECTETVLYAKQRIGIKFLESSILNTTQPFGELYMGQMDYSLITNIVDDDFFKMGTVKNQMLDLDIFGIYISINLVELIDTSLKNGKTYPIFAMLQNKYDLSKIDPELLLKLYFHNCNELARYLIINKFDNTEYNRNCLDLLAERGNLTDIEFFLTNYNLDRSQHVYLICCAAVIHGQVNILQHYLTPDVFSCFPDITRTYFLQSIIRSNSVDVIKFFIDNGESISRNNYEAFFLAVENEKNNFVKYFTEINTNVLDLISINSKINLGLNKIITMKKYIGIDKTCSLSTDLIHDDEYYYECRYLHVFDEDEWIEFCKSDNEEWKCPVCDTDVKLIRYHNTEN